MNDTIEKLNNQVKKLNDKFEIKIDEMEKRNESRMQEIKNLFKNK
jgi:hypothetical protein